MTRMILLSTAALALCACGSPAADDDTFGNLESDNVATAAQKEVGQVAQGYGGNDMADRDGADTQMQAAAERLEDMSMMMTRSFDVINSAGRSIGNITIADIDEGVRVDIEVTSIPPGEHAVHFHEVGRCDTPDFKSAGGHYNPGGVNHGFEADMPRPHAGDMRNVEAPNSGVVSVRVLNERVSLSPREGFAPLLDSNGTAFIMHAKADDYESQPSGAAGDRIACAVIAG